MLSDKEISELERKYSKYIFRKRVKLSIYIFSFLLSISFVVYFYLFYKSPIKQTVADINKSENSKIVEINSTKQLKNINLKKIMEKPKDINTSKVKNLYIKTEENLTENNTSKISENKIEENLTENNTSNFAKNNSETKLVFHIYPSAKSMTNNTKSKKLKLNLEFLSQLNKNMVYKKKNTVKNINNNDTIQEKENTKTKINIKMNNIDSIVYLKGKFQKTHDIVFALMLCENFYSKKEYRKSLKWSIIANDIDSQSERSWIWFAKSKYRLNKRNDAIKALRAYLKSNDSRKVKMLLKDIINGELYD